MKNRTSEILTLFFILSSTFLVNAQYDYGNQGVIYSLNSNVGVGTNNPYDKFQVNGSIGLGKFQNGFHSGLKMEYFDLPNGGGQTVFLHQRWAGELFLKRNSANGERNQFFFGGGGSHYMNIYGDNNDVKVRLNSSGTSYLLGGSLGIGTDNPYTSLHVAGTFGVGIINGYHAGLMASYIDLPNGGGETTFRTIRNAGGIYFKRGDQLGERNQFYFGGGGGHYMDIFGGNNDVKVRFASSGDSFMLGGRLGIGTDVPDHALTVKGTVHTHEVLVDTNPIVVPDYVFEKDYKLLPLSELEAYLSLHKHLPEVPSAKEIEQDGLKLKEMNLTLLKKVEELTLYIIELEKKNTRLEQSLSAIEILKKQVEAIHLKLETSNRSEK